VEYDKSIRPQRPADASIHPQSLLRSTTILSHEERTIGRSEPPPSREQSSHSASRASSHNTASPPSTVQVTAPHGENFYRYDWCWNLVLLIFTQALFLSFFVLAGAYGAYHSDSVLSPSQNPALLFSYILTWIIVYAPGTTIIYAACHLFLRASAHWKWRLKCTQWYDTKCPRPHTLQHTRMIGGFRVLFISPFLFFSFDLLIKYPMPAFWEFYVFMGWYLLIWYVVAAIFLIAVPWWIVLGKKLRRQAVRSS
jgi:hypothetical protein